MENQIQRNAITELLNRIFIRRFKIDLFDTELAVTVEDNILTQKFNLKATDLLYLAFDIEEQFQIELTEYDIDITMLNTIGNIIEILERKGISHKGEAV